MSDLTDTFEQELYRIAGLTSQLFLSSEALNSMVDGFLNASYLSVNLESIIKKICPYIVVPCRSELQMKLIINPLIVDNSLKGLVCCWYEVSHGNYLYVVASDLTTATFLTLALS